MNISMIGRGLAMVVLLVASAVQAEDKFVIADFSTGADAKGVPAGWQLKEKSGKAEFAVAKDGDINALRMKCVNASFSFEKEVDIDLKKLPVLTWKWKVTDLPKGGDFRKSKTDDQAAQLFVAFSKTRAIVYIWDTTAPKDLIADAVGPFFMKIKAVVVRSGAGETGKWITETRNVYEDYKKIFGEEPMKVNGMRLQINSQHTETSGESYFADVAYKKQ